MAAKDVVCEVCFRIFRKVEDKESHKCVSKRRKPVSKQLGELNCPDLISYLCCN